MGRAGHQGNAVRHRDPRHLKRSGQIWRTVVDAGQHVAVEVDQVQTLKITRPIYPELARDTPWYSFADEQLGTLQATLPHYWRAG